MEIVDEDTLRMLRDSAAAFTSGCAQRVRTSRELEPRYDESVWKDVAEQGWISAAIPAEKGGLGLCHVAVNVVAEQVGAAALPEPYISSGIIPAALLSECSSNDIAQEKLTAIAAGDLICAVAWQTEDGSLEPGDTGLQARPDGDGILITGTVHFVMGTEHDAIIAAAFHDDVLGLYWIPASAPNLVVQSRVRADWGHVCSISFGSVRIARQNCLAYGEQAQQALNAAINAGLVATASELNGVTGRMLEMTLEYLRTRHQFGKAIGSFQVLKHRAVDLWVHHEISKEATHVAALDLDRLDISDANRSAVASSVKARASDTALLVGKQAIQMHGAIGITDEYDLSLYFNRAIVLAAYLGNSALHRGRYASYRKG